MILINATNKLEIVTVSEIPRKIKLKKEVQF